jgi:hypothetical protein
MTIAKGQPWGEVVPRDPHQTVVSSDAALHRWVNEHLVPSPPSAGTDGSLIDERVTVAGGDLARTCGGGHPQRDTVSRVPLDLVLVRTDEVSCWMVSHALARRSWWRGEVVLAMNAQFLGASDVAPRSHPNDGRVDVLRVDPAMGVRTRLQARRRSRLGTHVPHPRIAVSQTRSLHLDLVTPLRVSIDGLAYGTTRTVELTVVADAYIADIA